MQSQGGICPEKCQLDQIKNGQLEAIIDFNMGDGLHVWLLITGGGQNLCIALLVNSSLYMMNNEPSWYLETHFI